MRVAVPLLPIFLIASTEATIPTLRFRTVIGDTSQPFTLTAWDNPKQNYIYSFTKAAQLPLLISVIGSRSCQTQAADRHSEFVNNESRPLGTQANEMHITGKIWELT